MSTEYNFSSYSSEYCLESYSEIREAEWCSGHEFACIPDLALTGMWPWTSLGLIFKLGILVIILYTIIVRMMRYYRVKCPALAWCTVVPGECLPPSWKNDKVAQSCPPHSQIAETLAGMWESQVDWVITLTEAYQEVTPGKNRLIFCWASETVYSNEGVFSQWWGLTSKLWIALVISTMIYKWPSFT